MTDGAIGASFFSLLLKSKFLTQNVIIRDHKKFIAKQSRIDIVVVPSGSKKLSWLLINLDERKGNTPL